MIKTKDFYEPCNCRSAGECPHNWFIEVRALAAMVDNAKEAMLKKLTKKYTEGWGGWDNPEAMPILKNKLIKHIKKDFTPENMIDIMNLAAMIRNQQI